MTNADTGEPYTEGLNLLLANVFDRIPVKIYYMHLVSFAGKQNDIKWNQMLFIAGEILLYVWYTDLSFL